MGLRGLLCAGCALFPGLALAAPPPASAYAEYAPATTAQLSPDGKLMLFINGSGDTVVPMVANLDTAKTTPIRINDATPDWVMWKDNQTVLTGVRVTSMLYGQFPIANTRLFAVSADGSQGTQIDFDRSESSTGGTYGDNRNPTPQIQDHVLSTLSDKPDHLLMEAPYLSYDYPTVFDVNPKTNNKQLVMGSFENIAKWYADPSGVVRAGIYNLVTDTHGGYDIHLIARSSESDGWHKANYELSDVAFSPADPSIVYALLTPREAESRVVAIDIASGTIKQTLASAPEGTLYMMTDNGRMVGYASYAITGSTYTYTDPDWAADAATITKATGVASVAIIDRSTDGQRVLALVRHLGKPDVAWLLDRTQNPANLAPVLTDYPNIPDSEVAPTRWDNVVARDGMKIPVLITTPIGGATGPIPFVVLPHGGPDTRDYGPFYWLVQFLVSRGYGVIQPEFRGSNGFGTAFRDAGNYQWGLAMQDDLTDATKWLVSQKLADPKKICIVGEAYGGYAALEGAVKEPGLYACAAALAPVTDIPLMLKYNRNFAFLPPKMQEDASQREAVSPAQHADQVQIPILMIHGRKDFTVWPNQTEKMEAALKSAGKNEQTIYLPNADHYFTHPADRLAVLNALEAFLKPVLQ